MPHFDPKAVKSSAETQKKELRESLVSLRNINKVAEEVHIKDMWLLDPGGKYHVMWDFFIGVIIFYSVISIPLRMAFEIKITCALYVSDWIETSLFALDFSQNFFTAVNDEINQRVITDKWEITREYLKCWFWIDLASTLPISEMIENVNYCVEDPADDDESSNSDLKTIRLVRILRLVRLAKLARVLKLGKLAQHIEALNISPALLNVAKLVMKIFFVAHLFSCIWHYLTLPDVIGTDPDQITWRREFESNFMFDMEGYRDADDATSPYNAEDADNYISSLGERYWASFYWTIATMLAVGYGDISATNTVERVYAILTMLCGGIMFGAVIAQVTRLIESRNPQARAFKNRMDELKAYLTEKKLPPQIRRDAKEAYSYYYTRQSTLAETGIFEDLPSHLLFKLIHNIYHKEIHKIALFRNMDDSFVQFILMNTRPFQAAAGELIFDSGDVAEEIVFIMQGLVRISIFDGRQQVVVGYAKEGGYFGDFEYHKHSTRIGRYTAVYSCNLLSISNKALDEAIDNNVDAGLVFKKDLRKRFEVVLNVNKTRTVAVDVPRDALTMSQLNDLNFQIQKASGGVQDTAKPTLMARVSGAGLGHSLKNTFTIMSTKRPVAVAAVELSDTETSSDEDNFDSVIKVKGDPTKPKIYMKKEIWVDGVPKANVSAALESSTLDTEDVRPFRVLKVRPNSVVDPVTGFRPKVVEEETPKQLSARGIIYHNDPRKLQWDTLVGLLIVYNVLLIPVQEGFSWTMGIEVFCIDLFSDIVFTIDIPLSFRTSFFDEDEDAVVTVHYMCRWNYLSSWFAIDIMAQVPFAMFVIFEIGLISKGQQEQLNSFSLIRIVRLLRLLKLARLAKLGHYITHLEDTLGVNPITFDLLKMMLEVVFIGHMLACTWWAAHSLTVNNWTNHPSYPLSVIDEDDYTSKYVISLYWAFTTLATVGYGDIVPTNMTHRIVVILIMVLGATVFGYIVANVSTLMSDLDQTAARVSERISEITEFLKEKNCPKQLHNSIIRHFRNMFNQTSAFDEPGILQRLPNRIIREILLTQHQNKIKKISLFNFIENQSVVLFIFRMMSPTYFEEHQAMLKEGEIGTEVLFVVSGRARVYKAKSTQLLVKARTERAKARKEEDIMEAQQREHTAKARRRSVSAKLATTGRRDSNSSSIDIDAEKTSAQQDVEQEMALTNSLGIVNECDFIGHVAMMFGSRHQATVRALSNVTTYGLSRMDFQRIVRDHPGVALVLQMAMGEAVHALHRDLGKSYSRDLRVDFLGGLKKTFGNQKEAREKLLRAEQLKMAKKEKSAKPMLARQGSMINFLGLGGSAAGNKAQSGNGFASPVGRPRLGSGSQSEADMGTITDDSEMVSLKSSPDGKAAVRMIKMGSAKYVEIVGSPGGADLVRQDSEGSSTSSSRFRMPNMLSFRGRPSSTDANVPVPGTKYVAPEKRAPVRDFSLHPFNHPSRVRARRRWVLIRKCLQDARVTATVASMNMHREAEAQASKKSMWGKRTKKKTPKEIAEAQLASVVRRNSVFARALQNKVGQAVGITLDDAHMVYDSDDDQRELVLIKKVAVKQKYRCAEDLDDWLDELRVPQTRPPPPNGRLLRRRSSFPSGSADEWRVDTRDLFVT